MYEGGFHLLIDLEGCNARLLDSPKAVRELCVDLAKLLKARVVQTGCHRFEPHGVTAFAIISESHISVHTWPESGKAFLDVFTCQESFDADPVIDHAVGHLGGKRGRIILILRDSRWSRILLDKRVSAFTTSFDFGRTILSVRSRLQHIELTKGPLGVSMFLDGYWQFVERYERTYHETLVHPAMVCAARAERVGIAGGGDGLALREVLKYPSLRRATLCEIDPVVLGVARDHPEMRRLNGDALRHPRAHVVAADARKMLAPGAGFDVLILDFPSISDGHKFGELYDTGFYAKARRALAPGGVLVTQVSDFPSRVLRVGENLRRVFGHVVPVDVGRQYSVFSFVLAADRPLCPRRPLPGDLAFMNRGRLSRILRQEVTSRAGAHVA
jgi:S-adenosylmethionine decarboxylase proenzyme